MAKTAVPPDKQYFTRGTAASRPQWMPVVALLVLCLSLAGFVTSIYHIVSNAPPLAEPDLRVPGASASVDPPYNVSGYALWAEIRMPADQADYTEDWLAREWARDVVATDSSGAPVVFAWDDRLTGYRIVEGDEVVVGYPVGTTVGHPASVTLPDVGATGFSVGGIRGDADVTDVSSLAWLLPASAAAVSVFATVRPRRPRGVVQAESEELARRAAARDERRSTAQSDELDSHYAAVERYQRDMDRYIRSGGDPASPAAPQPPVPLSTGSTGWGVLLIGGMVLAGPLLALGAAVVAIVTGGLQAIVIASPIAPLLPVAGDTAWRVFVMTATLSILMAIGPLILAMLASGFRVRTLRIALTAFAVGLVVICTGLAALALTLPVDRITA
ncbi:hypothetical protein QL996_00160 [Planococcus sp. APC 4015]|nr:hypothetical protein [Planococcus sp. APC 4015]